MAMFILDLSTVDLNEKTNAIVKLEQKRFQGSQRIWQSQAPSSVRVARVFSCCAYLSFACTHVAYELGTLWTTLARNSSVCLESGLGFGSLIESKDPLPVG